MQTGTQTILIVEDDPLQQELVEKGLSLAGYAIRTAASAAEMFERLADGPTDLVILDLGLPDGDALPHLIKLRENFDMPVMILTARERLDDRLMALGLGADDYLTKPVDLREIALRVGNILGRTTDGGRPATPAAAPRPRPTAIDTDALSPRPAPKRKAVPAFLGGIIVACAVFAAAGAYWTVTREAPASIASDKTGPAAAQPTADKAATRGSGSPAPAASIVSEGSRVMLTVEPTVSAGGPDAASDSAKTVGDNATLNNLCGPVPDVSWWKYKTHERLSLHVTHRYGGDWKPFIDNLVKRLANMRAIAKRKSAAVTPGGDRLEGKTLDDYIAQSVARLRVVNCLARQAKLKHARN